jgi:hypothetical protein
MSSVRRGQPRWRTPLLWTVVACAVAGAVAAARAVSGDDAVHAAPDALAGVAVEPTPAVPSPQAVPQTAPRRPTGQAALGCERCHGELELLRQQTGSLARAEQVFVPQHIVATSAHGDKNCAECHTGYARYPHDAQTTRTQTCVSCHAAADTLWRMSTHAGADDPVTCVQCHGSHDIRTADVLRSTDGAALANAPCLGCHHTDALPAHEPHAAGVSCAGCHAAHDTRPVDDPDSWLAPARQLQTCAACHEDAAGKWQNDIHGNAALREAHLTGRAASADVVLCTSCHLGHEMLAVEDERFPLASVERCSECHQEAARTFYNSYHGRATALGSRVSASCADCHGAHDILPDTFPASHVAQANLVQTCAACHEHARPAFVKYDSHPDPFNRARNPWIFYSFFIMNGLLVFVLLVFGGHTLLWWLRLWLDKRRGIIHGIGVHGHDHGSGHGTEQQEGGTA